MSSSTTISLRAAAVLAALVLCAPLAACKTPLERAWGLSQGAHVAQSIANPEAGLHDLEARRPDGQSTDAALTKYRQKEQEVAPPAPPSIININSAK
jgi:hypothetical protein